MLLSIGILDSYSMTNFESAIAKLMTYNNFGSLRRVNFQVELSITQGHQVGLLVELSSLDYLNAGRLSLE